MPYITYYRYGRPSVESVPNEIFRNLNVGNYGASGGLVDTDDGSSW